MGWRSVCLAALVAVLACNSPTLPLPPPALPTISAGSTPNTFHLKSDRGVIPNALVITVSQNEKLTRDERVAGTLADADGSWELDVVGSAGDLVDIQQNDHGTLSPPVTATLK